MANSKKEEQDGYLTPVAESLIKYGPSAFLAGAGLASLSYIGSRISKYLKEKKDNEEAEKGSSDILEVEIPTVVKKAEDTPNNYPGGTFMHNPLAILSSTIAAVLGYKAVKSVTNSYEKEESSKKLEEAKKEYSDALSTSILSSKEAIMKSFSAIDGLVDGIVKEIKMNKVATNKVIDNALSLPFTLAALSSIVAHNYVYNQEEEKREKDYKKPKPPVSIRLVSKPVDPEEDVYTEKQLQLKDKPKTASILMDLSNLTNISKLTEGRDHAETQKEVEKDKKQQSEPAEGRSEDIDSNSIMVHTRDGDVTVDAGDKRTKELLSKNKKKLTHILASGLNSLNS